MINKIYLLCLCSWTMGAAAQGLGTSLISGYQSGVKSYHWFNDMMGYTGYSVQLRLNRWQEKNWGDFGVLGGLRIGRFGLIVILVVIGTRRILGGGLMVLNKMRSLC